MSELVVDLTNPESVELAWLVLKALQTNKSGIMASQPKQELPPWEGPNEIDRASRGSQNDSKADDADPWATSASGPETPRAARSEPATSNQADAPASADDDDDDPWS